MSDDEQSLIARQILNEVLAEELSWGKTIQVGDWIDCRENATYFSGSRYKTKNKLYRIFGVRSGHDGKMLAVAWADVPGEYVYFSSSRVIIRDGVVIWRNGVYERLMADQGRDLSDYPILAECIFDLDAAMREAGLCK